MENRDGLDRSLRFAEFLAGAGALGEGIRQRDWSRTSLGPIEAWPDALRNTVRLVLTSRQPMVFFWGADLLQFFNESYAPILNGMPEDPIGAPFKRYWAEVFEGVRPFFEEAMSGRGTWSQDLPLMLTRNGVTEQTYWTFSYSPLYDDEGSIAGFMNVVNETTRNVNIREELAAANARLTLEYARTRDALARQQEAEKQQRFLQRELSHRMKNTLAMVQSIAAQTFRQAKTIEEGQEAISGRIAALARAQDILTRTSWDAASIGEVVDDALAPHRDFAARFEVGGPELELTAQQGLGLALALHELATNAAKYGALSADTGRIRVRWATMPEAAFRFEWVETGGPPVDPPGRAGFGSRLLQRVVPSYFRGAAQFRYDTSGLTYLLDGTLGA